MTSADQTAAARTAALLPGGGLAPGVAIAATMDTKGEQVDYLRAELERRGLRAIVVDCSIRPPAARRVDIVADLVARLAGSDIDTVRGFPERAPALGVMLDGVEVCIARLHALGLLRGFIGVGGGTNASLAARAFRALPYGLPKILVSTTVSGDTKPYIEGRDVLLVHSVVDFIGLNAPLRASLARAAAAMAAMQDIPFWDAAPPRSIVGVTATGATTPAAEAADAFFRGKGLQTWEFHARGPGGMAFEDLITQGRIGSAFDLATTEIADEVVGGLRSAGPGRLDAATRLGLPQVVIPGGIDIVNFSGPESVPARFAGRLFAAHTPASTLMRTLPDESEAIGMWIGNKLAAATAPVSVFVPMVGFSSYDRPGAAFHDPQATRAFIAGVQRALAARADIPVELIDAHVNDRAFVLAACERLWQYLQGSAAATKGS